ncbi:MAG: hypothetical protein EOP45_01740 [Sphingobacteriaceae bacterium]|nr:MAG: hypothetical protein EOP45_01740 [Sphingobacteriaceae bacterium]
MKSSNRKKESERISSHSFDVDNERSPDSFNEEDSARLINQRTSIMQFHNLKKYLAIAGVIALVGLGSFILFFRSKMTNDVDPLSSQNTAQTSEIPLYGLMCADTAAWHKDPNEYLAVIIVMKNKRSVAREWIEFNLMMGVDHFLIFDNLSSDGLEQFLAPYIREGIVTYTRWPPAKDTDTRTNHSWDHLHPNIKAFYDEKLTRCYLDNYLNACFVSAIYDGIRVASERGYRWIGHYDVDEFFFIPETSPMATLSKPLAASLRSLEEYPQIDVFAEKRFGSNGYLSHPRRDDDQEYASLITKTHPYHAPSIIHAWLSSTAYSKSFVNPRCVIMHYIHGAFTLDPKRLEINHETALPSGAQIFYNHYVLYSYLHAIAKVENRQIPVTAKQYDIDIDRFITKEAGSPIDYLLPQLESRIKESYKSRTPADNHADDWDYTLVQKHQPTALQKHDLCVILMSPRHIGLARQALTSIIYYLDKIEPSLVYELVVYDSEERIKDEIRNDFPIDSFKSIDEQKEICASAKYILNLKEDSFARYEVWYSGVPAIKMGIQVLEKDDQVDAIYLSGSLNSVSEWKNINLNDIKVNYRENPKLLDAKGTFLIRRGVEVSNNMYELCLENNYNCGNNSQIQGLFVQYEQERSTIYRPNSDPGRPELCPEKTFPDPIGYIP